MNLAEKILHIYPELVNTSCFYDNTIILQNDSDGNGTYIAIWNYEQPEPTQEQLDSYV